MVQRSSLPPRASAVSSCCSSSSTSSSRASSALRSSASSSCSWSAAVVAGRVQADDVDVPDQIAAGGSLADVPADGWFSRYLCEAGGASDDIVELEQRLAALSGTRGVTAGVTAGDGGVIDGVTADDGSGRGVIDGVTAGVIDGVTGGVTAGDGGVIDGVTADDGSGRGVIDGVTAGVIDGVTGGVTAGDGGVIDGVTAGDGGVIKGVIAFDGSGRGVIDGVTADDASGRGVIAGDGGIMSTNRLNKQGSTAGTKREQQQQQTEQQTLTVPSTHELCPAIEQELLLTDSDVTDDVTADVTGGVVGGGGDAASDHCSTVYHQIMHSLGLAVGGDDNDAHVVSRAATTDNAAARRATVRVQRPAASGQRPVAVSAKRVGGKCGGCVANAAPATRNSAVVAAAKRSAVVSLDQHRAVAPGKDDVTQRYLKFIDELIEEKRELVARCETLSNQASLAAEKHQKQLSGVKERHKEQLQAAKRGVLEGEKGRRQKWMDSEREKIKDLCVIGSSVSQECTARGMQSQIEQMVRQHAEELARVRDLYECRLQAGGGGVATVGGTDTLRSRLLLEKDDALQQATASSGRAYFSGVASHDQQMSEAAREHETQLAHLTQQLRQLKQQLDSAEAAAIADQQKAEKLAEQRVAQLRQQMQEQWHAEQLQLQQDMQSKERDICERMRVEMQSSLDEQKQQLINEADQRLKAELQRAKEERDARVEDVVVRLEQEVRRVEEREAAAFQQKLKSAEERHETHARALEAAEQRARNQYLECRRQMAQQDEKMLQLRSCVERKNAQIGDMKQTAEMLQQEQQQLGDVIESEFRQQLTELRQSTARWQQRAADAEKRLQAATSAAAQKVAALQRQRRVELEALHVQIKEAFLVKEQKSDDNCEALRTSRVEIKQLESLIDKMQLVGATCRCSGKLPRPD